MIFAVSALSTFFLFNETTTTEIYTLSLHDALPILVETIDAQTQAREKNLVIAVGGHDGAAIAHAVDRLVQVLGKKASDRGERFAEAAAVGVERSEEHTSELQSLRHLVCRLLLEKKK